MQGKVKWFDPKLGYGFIESKDAKKEIFVHYSEINMEGFKVIYEDDIVEFDYDEDSNKATNLNIILKGNLHKEIESTKNLLDSNK